MTGNFRSDGQISRWAQSLAAPSAEAALGGRFAQTVAAEDPVRPAGGAAEEHRAGAFVRRVVRRPSVRAAPVYLLLVVLCLLAAYWAMFSSFQTYDDEGFFDYSLKLFVSGHPLYTSVFSDYGPFYYEFFGALLKLTGRTISTDTGRIMQLSLWVLCSLGLGLAAHRLTHRLSIGVAAMSTVFGLLVVMTAEPMHAGALICGLLAAMALVIAFLLEARPRAASALLGAIVGALALTKVNVGGFAVISLFFAVVMISPTLRRLRILRLLAVVAFVAVGPAIMESQLNNGWARSYALLAVASTLGLVFSAWPVEGDELRGDPWASWTRWLIGGFVGAWIVILGVIFALGSNPGDLFDQIVVVPSNQSGILTVPLPLTNPAVWWALGAAGLAWTVYRQRLANPGAHSRPTWWGGAGRAVAGALMLLSLVGGFPFNTSTSAPFAFAMPLAWLAAVPPAGGAALSHRQRLVRLLIPSLAVLQALLAYPVAGSQMRFGAILLVLCAAQCLADGFSELTTWVSRPENRGAGGAPSGALALFVVLAVGLAYSNVVQPLQGYHDTYRSQVPLTIPGATRLRQPPAAAAQYEAVVAGLQSRCRTLISLPGLYSFNLWTRLPAPSGMTGEQPFWLLLSNAQQLGVISAAKRSPGLCALEAPSFGQAFYAGGKAIPRSPLVRFIEDDFVPFASYGPYNLETRRR